MNYRNITLKGKQQQKGFTLIELLVVVGLIALGIAGIVGVYVLVQGGQRGNEVSQYVLTLQTGVRQLYPQPSYPATLTQTTLISAGKAPKKIITSATTLSSPWGAAITVAGNQNYNGGTGNAYNITLASAPQNSCNDVTAAVSSQFQKIVVGTTTVKDDSAGTALDPANVATACNNAAGTNVVLTGSG